MVGTAVQMQLLPLSRRGRRRRVRGDRCRRVPWRATADPPLHLGPQLHQVLPPQPQEEVYLRVLEDVVERLAHAEGTPSSTCVTASSASFLGAFRRTRIVS